MTARWLIPSFLLLTGCASFKTFNQTEMFIDIETQREDTWLGCSIIDPRAEISLMTFYLLAGDTTHEFIFRKVSDVDWCLKTQKKYQRLTKNAPTVRMVGVSASKRGPRELVSNRVPGKFNHSPQKINWYFVRLQTENGCESYFTNDCKPENYWSGTEPPNE